jgi:ATP-dependent RNA helicase RhlE
LDFSDFGFDPSLMEGIEAMGYETPTPIQQKAIPAILEGRDIMGSAQTGTGKTAAFLLPVIQKIIASGKGGRTRALVIVPTRELAMQIDQHMEGFSYFTPVGSIAVYGGGDGALFAREKKALVEGTEVVVCTPGRMISHLNNTYVDFSGLEYLVLDEADRMLDMGFYDDIMKIIQYLPKQRQNLMFAATMPDEIRKLANRVLRDPVEVNIALSKPVEKVLQVAYAVYETQKLPLKSVIVFCSTKASAKQLGRQLKREGLLAQDIHSDLDQKTREEIMLQFRNRKLNILVATDLLSRGIDIDNIELILNYDVPHDGEDYIHRIGRTARAESDGVAITLISEKEQHKFARIERLLEKPVTKSTLPVEFGEAPEYNPARYRGQGGYSWRKGSGGKGSQGSGGKRPGSHGESGKRPGSHGESGKRHFSQASGGKGSHGSGGNWHRSKKPGGSRP